MNMLAAIATPAVTTHRDGSLPEVPTTYRWVWLVLIGILVVAAAVAWVYCRNAGYAGFEGHIEAVRVGGIKIGIKLGCY